MVARHCAISAVRKAEKPQLAGGSVVAHIAHWMPTSAVSTFTRARAYKRKGLSSFREVHCSAQRSWIVSSIQLQSRANLKIDASIT